jgi:hypothetical protein
MIIVAIGKNLPSSFIIINQNSKPILFSVTLGSIAVYAKDFYLKHCSLKLHNYAQFVNFHTIYPIIGYPSIGQTRISFLGKSLILGSS